MVATNDEGCRDDSTDLGYMTDDQQFTYVCLILSKICYHGIGLFLAQVLTTHYAFKFSGMPEVELASQWIKRYPDQLDLSESLF